jgi:hypothetical protein
LFLPGYLHNQFDFSPNKAAIACSVVMPFCSRILLIFSKSSALVEKIAAPQGIYRFLQNSTLLPVSSA